MVRKFFFYLIMLGIVFVTFECFALLVNAVADPDDIYDQRESVLDRLNAEDLAKFVRYAGDPILGWDHRGPVSERARDCSGAEVIYTHDAQRARTYSGYDRDHVKILVVGDSYTDGMEVNDDQAYPAALAYELGVSVANHGMGGTGPVQAFLNLKQKIGLYPEARVVILGIMYENVYRMVNSYRPVLYEGAADYGLKPYIANGEIMPHPGQEVLEDINRFKEAADNAFERDFWAKPKPAFPYFVSLLRGLGSHYFRYLRMQKVLRNWGIPEYRYTYRSELFVSELVSLLNQYARFAGAANLTPVAIFIPRNRYDTRSAGEFIEANRSRLADGLVLGDVGSADIDWSMFNQTDAKSGDPCHPSPYGYERVAAYIADLLRTEAVWPGQSSAGLPVDTRLAQQ